jgi:uncharacterized protein
LGKTFPLFKAGGGRRRADVNAADNKGGTSLMYAADYARTDAVKSLLDLGADPSPTDKKSRTALQIPAASNQRNSKRVVPLLKAVTKE